MKEAKKVSFLIPCYNHEAYVRSCLQSILQQDYGNFEVMIADDGSKDHSVDIIRQMEPAFREKGHRFVLLSDGVNRGIPKNLNRMLELAEGDYVKIIASDDMLAPDYLSKMVSYMEEHPQLMMAFSNGYRVDEDTVLPVTEEYILGDLIQGKPDCVDDVFNRVYECNFVPAPSLMVRASLYEEIHGYDETIQIEDLDMLLRMLIAHPNGLGMCDEYLTYYRVSGGSISSNAYTKGALRRTRFMYENSMKIARKFQEDVPEELFKKRVRKLKTDYLYIRANLALRGIFR